MYCTKCGRQNRDGARFCAFCGAPLRQKEQEQESGTAEAAAAGKRVKRIQIICVVIFLLMAAVISVLFLFVLPKQKEKRYETGMAEANRYLEETDYESAEAAYLAVLDIEPKKEEPYLKLAELYYAQDEQEKAVQILREGAEITQSPAIQKKYDLYSYVEEVLIPELGQCEAGEYTCNYIRTELYTGVEPVRSQSGVLNSRIRDFDRDGEEELLVLVMDNEEQADDAIMNVQNAVDLRMYEAEDEGVVLADEFTELKPVFGVGDKEKTGVFLKENKGQIYICGGMYNLVYTYADGSNFNSFVVTYEDGKFVKRAGTDGTVSGSDFRAIQEDAYVMADYLEEIGLPNEAEQIRSTYMKRFTYADDVEMLMLIEGENDGTGDIERFYETTSPEDLGKIKTVLKLSWEEGEEGAEPETDGSAESQAEEQKAESQADADTYENVYGSLLEQAYEKYKDAAGEYLLYFVCDIDKNGVDELLLQTGTCEADYMYKVYTIENKDAVYLGEISGGHTVFYADENGGTEPYIIQVQAHMGYEQVYHVSVRDGKVSSQLVSEGEIGADETYYMNDHPVEYLYITDHSLLRERDD